MVAYSFKPRFEMPILGLQKTGTIRAQGRRRHARPGETLQLYTGMRTKQCRLLARAVCCSVDRLRVWFDQPRVIIGELAHEFAVGETNHCYDFDEFARADGFTGFDDMAAFWWDTHRAREVDDIWVRWSPDSVTPAL